MVNLVIVFMSSSAAGSRASTISCPYRSVVITCANETTASPAGFAGSDWVVLCRWNLSSAHVHTATPTVRLRRPDDARAVFCAWRISANGCAKAVGPSQSDFLRRMGTLAHDAVVAVQASQLKQLRSELLPLTAVAFLCVALVTLSPPKQVQYPRA